jgi:hypothetical protein
MHIIFESAKYFHPFFFGPDFINHTKQKHD